MILLKSVLLALLFYDTFQHLSDKKINKTVYFLYAWGYNLVIYIYILVIAGGMARMEVHEKGLWSSMGHNQSTRRSSKLEVSSEWFKMGTTKEFDS